MLKADRRDVYVDVDSVDERAGDFRQITFDLARRAFASAKIGPVVAAGAGIAGGDQKKSGEIGYGFFCAGHGNGAVFEGLAYHFKDVARKLRELVEEQDSVMGKRQFARSCVCAAAHQSGAACGVVRHTDGARRQQGLAFA